ncbi:MAG: hypothetical protein ACWGPN_13785 [Gammaproteobacteria bacterium]
MQELQCWKCGEPVRDEPMPLARLAECRQCRAELHVCRMCEFYDTAVAKHCREPVAEEVHEKERANFCDYFAVTTGAYIARDEAPAERARRELGELFGGVSEAPSPDDADEARRQLERPFGDDADR